MSRIEGTEPNRPSGQSSASPIPSHLYLTRTVPPAPATRRRVILAGFYPPPLGGEAIHVKQLVRLLRERGMDVEVLNLNRRAEPSTEYRSARSRLGLLMMLVHQPERSALLHLHANGHNWMSWTIIAVIALTVRLKGIVAALTVHSGLCPEYVNYFGPMRRWGAAWILRSFRRIVSVNSEILKTVHGLGIVGPQCIVISPFLGVAVASDLNDADRALTHRFHPLLVTVAGGDRDPERGLPTVAHACKQLLPDMPTLGVVFLGSHVGRIIRPMIWQLGLSERAVCLGEVSHERCLSLIRAADVVVRSTFADGDSIAVREAVGLGVPVVASDTDYRPDGVALFRKGNAVDLHRQVTRIIRRDSRPNITKPADQQFEDAHWQLYLDLAHSGSVVPARPPAPRVSAG
jgi:glycosyltransferase involved in cell wall biosynthesis